MVALEGSAVSTRRHCDTDLLGHGAAVLLGDAFLHGFLHRLHLLAQGDPRGYRRLHPFLRTAISLFALQQNSGS